MIKDVQETTSIERGKKEVKKDKNNHIILDYGDTLGGKKIQKARVFIIVQQINVVVVVFFLR